MSVHYDIKEHLIVKGRQPAAFITPMDDVVGTIQYQLSLLGALILQENAFVDELVLVADGVTYTFSGNEVTPELGKVMKALNTAGDLELTIRYNFTRYGMNGVSHDAGPQALMELLKKMKEEEMDGIFYSAWCKADCNGDAGDLYAYGNHNGTFHSGAVKEKPVTAYPAGKWYAETDLVVDLEGLSPEQVQKTIAICHQLNQLTDYPEGGQQIMINDILTTVGNPIDFSEDSVSYYMNDVRLQSEADIARLLALFSALNEVTDGGCGCIGEYMDLSGPDARIMCIDYSSEGPDCIKVAAI